jgi:hypothetical protein
VSRESPRVIHAILSSSPVATVPLMSSSPDGFLISVASSRVSEPGLPCLPQDEMFVPVDTSCLVDLLSVFFGTAPELGVMKD